MNGANPFVGPLETVATKKVDTDPALTYAPPSHELSNNGSLLTGPKSGDAFTIATDYLNAHADELGVTTGDLSNYVVTDQYVSQPTGMTLIYLQQTHNGLPVSNALLNISVSATGEVISAYSTFVKGLSSPSLTAATPQLTAAQALTDVAGQLGLSSSSGKAVQALNLSNDLTKASLLSAPGISEDPVPAKLQYVVTPDGVELAWKLVIRTTDGEHWYDASANASTGKLVANNDWVDHATYKALAIPNESVQDGGFSLITNPQDPTASPFGWHDTNGVAGAEFTDTEGNNVDAHLDRDGNDSPDAGSRPSGGASLDFSSYTFNPSLAPSATVNENASVLNMFYANNILHDIHYHYGFTESAGNFQVNNYGKGGTGGDAVQADGQDKADLPYDPNDPNIDNANFATPPDGQSPRMQMYEFTATSPRRDSGLDNGVMFHEYGHGVSNRLTGGPANSNALDATQSGGMGEGWSDFWALMLTQRPTDTQNQAMPLGTYVEGQSPTGGGIRQYPYSFNMTVDPHTLNDYNGDGEVHDTGEIWASTLWDMNWALINKYGYDSNLYTGYDKNAALGTPAAAGNKLALQLVMDALKIQPANPTFTQARNAIIAADQALTGGKNFAELWTVFARRGLGASASSGASSNSTTVSQAFDLPTAAIIQEKFDSVTSPALPFEWSSQSASGSSSWTTSTATPFSGANDAFVPDVATASDTSLVSPVLTYLASNNKLSFQNSYDTQAGADFASLDISINGAPFVDIVTAGGSFATGGAGYTAGSGWSGNSGGYVQTSVNLPASAIGKPVQFRWQLTTNASTGGNGWRIDDVSLDVPPQPDFGDLPDSYGTSLAANGARHTTTGPTLGTKRDGEPDAALPLDGTGDDLSGIDDDDGVTAGVLRAGTTGSFTVNVSAASFLNAWADLNGNSIFDAGEQFAINKAMTAGNNLVSITLPASPTLGTLYVRFRLTSATVASPSPLGLLPDGEVEDYAFQIGSVFENFDSVTTPNLPVGWTQSASGNGFSNWTTSASTSNSAPNSAFVADNGDIADNILISPSFTYPAGAQISFQNYYQMENTYDGGVLEISINGGAFTDITATGGNFVAGGYNNTIDLNYGNPLAGRSAWSGDSGGYTQTIVNLPASGVGQSVKLRWREGTDDIVGSSGWHIDDITSSFIPPWSNVAPVLSNVVVTLNDVAQNSPLPSGPVGTLVSSMVDLADGVGRDNVTDPDTNAVTGIAIVASDVTKGSWFYSTNNGSSWASLGTPSLTAARLLAADSGTRLYFRPVAGFAGTIAAGVTFLAWDRTAGTNGATANVTTAGGSTPYSTTSDTASIKVSNVAPILAGTNVVLNSIPQDSLVPVGQVGTLVSSMVDLVDGSGRDNVTDPDPGAVTGIAVIASDETNGVWYYSLNNGSSWVLLGTPSDTVARLLAADANSRVYFRPAAGYFGTVPDGLTFRAWDRTSGATGATANVTTNGGETAYSAATNTASITVLEPNHPPVLADTNVTLNNIGQNSPAPSGAVGTLVSALVDLVDGSGLDNVTDADTGAVTGIAVTASDVTKGSWFYSTNNGANWSPLGTPSDTTARLLAADAGTRLYFQPVNAFVGTVATGLTFHAWDQTAGTNGGTADVTLAGGTSPYSIATDTASIRVTNAAPALADTNVVLDGVVQDSPTPAGPVGTLVSALVDLAGGAGLNNVTDADFSPLTGMAVIASDETKGTWFYSTDNGANWTPLGSLSDTTARLLAADAATRLYFQPVAGFFGAVPSVLTFRAWDQTSGVNGGTADASVNGAETAFSTASDTADITVLKANEAPVLTDANVTLNNIALNSPAPSGAVGTLVSSLVDLNDGSGLDNVSDGDPGAVTGIAVVASDVSNGSWFYSTNNGGNWSPLGTPSGTSARLLAADAGTRLYFQPANGFIGTITAAVTFRAWDQTTGTNGGTASVVANGGKTPFSTATDTASIKVFNVAPSLADAAVALDIIGQNSPAPAGAVGTLVSALVDLTGGSGLNNVTDADFSPLTGMAVIASDETNGTWFYSTNNGVNWSPLGTSSDTTARLLAADAGTRLYFQPVRGYSGTFSSGLTFRAWDQTSGVNGGTADVTANGGESAYSAETDTADYTVKNDAPVLDNSGSPVLIPVAKSTTNPQPTPVGSFATAGYSDVNPGTIFGAAAVTNVDSSHGHWDYSIDAGATWGDLSTVSLSSARLLLPTDLVRFRPNSGYSGMTTITFNAWDQTSGDDGDTADLTAGTGGATAFSVASETATLRAATVIAITPEDGANLGNKISDIRGATVKDTDFKSLQGAAIIGFGGTLPGHWEYSTGGAWKAFGVVDDAHALPLRSTDKIRFVADTNQSGEAYFKYREWDQTEGKPGVPFNLASPASVGGSTAFSGATDIIFARVAPVNDKPVLDAASKAILTPVNPTVTPTDADPAGDLVSDILAATVTDPDPGLPPGLAVTAVGKTGGTWQYQLDGATTWTPMPAVSAAKALLLGPADRVRFLPVASAAGKFVSQSTLSFKAWDRSGGGTIAQQVSTTATTTTAFSVAVGTAVVNVTTNPAPAPNDAPLLDNTPDVVLTATAEDNKNPAGTPVFAMLGAAVTDSGPLQGIAVTGLTGRTTGVWQYSSNGKTWKPVGVVSPDNAILLKSTDQIRYLPNLDFNGTVSVSYHAWDQTRGTAGQRANLVPLGATDGTSAFSTDEETGTLTVTPVNDPPVLDITPNPMLTSVLSGATNPAGDLVSLLLGTALTDIDPGPVRGIAITKAGSSVKGNWQFQLQAPVPPGSPTGWSSIAGLSATNVLYLRDTDKIRFVPVPGFQGTDTISYRGWDGTAGTAGKSGATTGTALSKASETATVYVNTANVNNRPQLDTAPDTRLPAIPLNAGSSQTGTLVSAVLGTLVHDPDVGALSGMAVTAVDGKNGTWQFSVNNGTTWTPLTGVSAAKAVVLRSTDRIRFVPLPGIAGLTTFKFKAWDQSDHSVPGSSVPTTSTAFSTAIETVTLSVNTAPLLFPF
ncbi:M36 family metallopeptidase [Zavarzinella formosa]|uniref:M36 family metallopeptidase n=1 Tax=Zavarzinella formosa TaxID=360055 RepID=UPI00031F8300|nr:M36 family metallopeptidase [Zavarzinella formosa]